MENINFIVSERSRYHNWQGTGLLSIKSFYDGQAFYDIGRGAFLVDNDSYLILNHGQEYTITIDSKTEVTSFCVFFAADFAEEVNRSLTTKTETLLDDPIGANTIPTLFFQRTYRHDMWLSPVLHHVRESLALRQQEPGWLEEQFHRLMHQLLFVHQQTCREVEILSEMRVRTREELYRRLHLARDYISASYDQRITLEDIAYIACMSPNHLIRTFKQVFKQTPHQFLTSERLRHARRLLTTTEQSVTDVCIQVGFESLGSFSWLFTRRFGMSPQAFRSQRGDFREV